MYLLLHQGDAGLVTLEDLDGLLRVAQLRREVYGPEDFWNDLVGRSDKSVSQEDL
jgi:hypothetical protein